MESQNKEKEYEHSVWEIYRKEFATASEEKRVELNKRMLRWQELMKSGLLAQQAYYKAMEEELAFGVAKEPSDKSPRYSRWSSMPKVPAVILIVALIAAIVYSVVTTMDRNTLNTELESVQSVLASTQSKLGSTNETLTSTQSELISTQLDLDSTELELTSTKQKLSSTQTELSSTKQILASTQSDLTTTKQTLASTQQQLTVAQETLVGLGITLSTSKECYDATLIDNPTAKNPTWSQLIAFLSQDHTEQYTYNIGVYDCSEFSRDVHNNAEAAGIRAAMVHIGFRNEIVGHALNAFLTSDYGLVYVDCTGNVDCTGEDTIARVKAGKDYRAVELYRITRTNVRNNYWWDTLSSYYYIPSSLGWSNKATSSIEIYW